MVLFVYFFLFEVRNILACEIVCNYEVGNCKEQQGDAIAACDEEHESKAYEEVDVGSSLF